MHLKYLDIYLYQVSERKKQISEENKKKRKPKMKLDKLKQLEETFFTRYPIGFETPELVEIGKKHRVDKMQAFVKESFTLEQFNDSKKIVESFAKMISRSSLVSVFEKSKFRDVVKTFDQMLTDDFAQAIMALLYGDQEMGFNYMVQILNAYSLAKWPVLTVLLVYWNPKEEVLVKPTTVKGVLKYFEVDEFKYTPKPDFDFYRKYRDFINEIKRRADKNLDVDNDAFCGFLMISIE